MAEDKSALERTLAGTFQAELQISQQRRLVVTGHIYSDDTPEEINARVDLYQDTLDRQFIRCDIVNKRAQREATIQAMHMHAEQLEELQAMQLQQSEAKKTNGDGKIKLTSQQHEILKRGQESLRQHKKNIELLDSLIAAAEKKLAAPLPA